MKPISVNINFYGHSVDIHPEDIADNLDFEATDAEIKSAVCEDVDNALHDDEFPSYRADVEDVVEAVRAELNRRKSEEE